MKAAALPSWDHTGVMPPVRPGVDGHSPDRSPYISSLSEVTHNFALSRERIQILKGLLSYRSKLHEAGLVSGFQWLDGSYTEHVEVLEGRAPRDIDVVTFFHLPVGDTQRTFAEAHPNLFNHTHVKKAFCVDSYYFPLLGATTTPHTIKQVSYWYSMWSHRRTGQWKGFVQVDLSPDEDADVMAQLIALEEENV